MGSKKKKINENTVTKNRRTNAFRSCCSRTRLSEFPPSIPNYCRNTITTRLGNSHGKRSNYNKCRLIALQPYFAVVERSLGLKIESKPSVTSSHSSHLRCWRNGITGIGTSPGQDAETVTPLCPWQRMPS